MNDTILKDQDNYFNVKFLKDYGFLIKVKDSKIILKKLFFIYKIYI